MGFQPPISRRLTAAAVHISGSALGTPLPPPRVDRDGNPLMLAESAFISGDATITGANPGTSALPRTESSSDALVAAPISGSATE